MADKIHRSLHRAGHRYRVAKAIMFNTYGHTCIHCGHDGANEADHIIPVSVDPDQPIDPEGMRPSHGVNSPCQICGCVANQRRGNRMNFVQFRPHLTW